MSWFQARYRRQAAQDALVANDDSVTSDCRDMPGTEVLHVDAALVLPPLPIGHPLYDDEALVTHVTREHIAAGRTIFQLWMTDPVEAAHAAITWGIAVGAAGGPLGRVLSLGSGVGGMEALWARLSPSTAFTLVNRSQAQLCLSLCSGEYVLADAETWRPPEGDPGYDCIVLAYVLGHLHYPAALLDKAKGWLRPGGCVLVLDIANGSDELHDALHYRTVATRVLDLLGYEHVHELTWHLHAPLDGIDTPLRELVGESTPGMWLYRDVPP